MPVTIKIDRDKVASIEVFDGNTGRELEITDEGTIAALLDELDGAKLIVTGCRSAAWGMDTH